MGPGIKTRTNENWSHFDRENLGDIGDHRAQRRPTDGPLGILDDNMNMNIVANLGLIGTQWGRLRAHMIMG